MAAADIAKVDHRLRLAAGGRPRAPHVGTLSKSRGGGGDNMQASSATMPLGRTTAAAVVQLKQKRILFAGMYNIPGTSSDVGRRLTFAYHFLREQG